MAAINIEHIQPDMVLSGDVKDRHGRVLLPSGTALTEKHIGILKTWGINEASIENVSREDIEAQAMGQIDSGALEEAQTRVNNLFRLNSKEDEFIDELMRNSVYRIARKIEKERARK